MSQKESRLSLQIQKALRAEYGRELFIFKVHGSAFMMAGLPDLIGVVRGMFFALETKIPDHGNDLDARQRYVIARIERAGGRVGTPRSVADALAYVAAWIDPSDA